MYLVPPADVLLVPLAYPCQRFCLYVQQGGRMQKL